MAAGMSSSQGMITALPNELSTRSHGTEPGNESMPVATHLADELATTERYCVKHFSRYDG